MTWRRGCRMTIECTGVFVGGGYCWMVADDEAQALADGWEKVDGAWVCPWCLGVREVDGE